MLHRTIYTSTVPSDLLEFILAQIECDSEDALRRYLMDASDDHHSHSHLHAPCHASFHRIHVVLTSHAYTYADTQMTIPIGAQGVLFLMHGKTPCERVSLACSRLMISWDLSSTPYSILPLLVHRLQLETDRMIDRCARNDDDDDEENGAHGHPDRHEPIDPVIMEACGNEETNHEWSMRVEVVVAILNLFAVVLASSCDHDEDSDPSTLDGSRMRHLLYEIQASSTMDLLRLFQGRPRLSAASKSLQSYTMTQINWDPTQLYVQKLYPSCIAFGAALACHQKWSFLNQVLISIDTYIHQHGCRKRVMGRIGLCRIRINKKHSIYINIQYEM
jgi:hypothetical protein